MPLLKVLLNARGEVVGTARTDAEGTGLGVPLRATPIARAGQQLVEISVDDKEANLHPTELHALIAKKHVKAVLKAQQPESSPKSKKKSG